MFALMGNCISCIKQRKQPKRNVTVAILGLDSAGKTTTTKALLGEPLETAPTIGFNKEIFSFKNYNITLYDLGGGKKIRDIWKEYLSEIYGVIYVVDSSTRERVPEVRDNLRQLLQYPEVNEKPLLILGNKQDLPNHMEEVDILEGLEVEAVVNLNKCPSRLELCSAIKGTGKKMDPSIQSGMTWFCGVLDQLYTKLQERVARDTEIVEARRQKEKEERKERVRLIREERQRKEEEEKKRLGIEEEEEEEDDIVDGDPFRQLTAEEIQRKEEKYKKTKAKDKEKQRRLQELKEQESYANNSARTDINDNDNNDDDDLRVPRSSRSIISTLGLGSAGVYGGNSIMGHDVSPRLESSDTFPRTLQSRQLLPPLQTGAKFSDDGPSPRSGKENKKKKTKKNNKPSHYDDGNRTLGNVPMVDIFSTSQLGSPITVVSRKQTEDNDSDEITGSERGFVRNSKDLYKHKGGNITPEIDDWSRGRRKKVADSDEEGFDTLRLSQHLDDVPLDTLDGKMNGLTEERSETPVKKLKKKKKRNLRKNKTHPSDEEDFELSDAQSTPNKPWLRSPSPRHLLDAEDLHTNSWRMPDAIHDVEDLQPVSRGRPNMDSEDDLIL